MKQGKEKINMKERLKLKITQKNKEKVQLCGSYRLLAKMVR